MTAPTLPRRPMLGPVLDALTTARRDGALPSELLRADGAYAAPGADGVDVRVRGGAAGHSFHWLAGAKAAVITPAEALELLQARDIVPLDYRGRWVCSACDGRRLIARPGVMFDAPCRPCRATGTLPHPPTVAALASWASLGWAQDDDRGMGVAVAEALARELDASAEVVWRVGAVEASGAATQRPMVVTTADNPEVLLRLWRANISVAHRSGRVTLTVPPLGAQP